jgi:putative flippase GtrA
MPIFSSTKRHRTLNKFSVGSLAKSNKFVVFVFFGLINTALTYLIYLLLLMVTDFRISYTISFISGIVFAFYVQSKFVFQTPMTGKKAALFPIIYLAQYLIGLAVITVCVNSFHIPASFALAVSILITVPLTFFLSRFVLSRE